MQNMLMQNTKWTSLICLLMTMFAAACEPEHADICEIDSDCGICSRCVNGSCEVQANRLNACGLCGDDSLCDAGHSADVVYVDGTTIDAEPLDNAVDDLGQEDTHISDPDGALPDAANADTSTPDVTANDSSQPDLTDVTPPGPVSTFTALPGTDFNTLSWLNPVDSDLDHVLIRRSSTAYPTQVGDGDLICSACTSPYSDTGLADGITYYYTAWAYDHAGNASQAAHAQGTPLHVWGSDSLQQAYVKASNTGAVDEFGRSTSLSADGNTMVVAAPYERSAATDIDGNQHDDNAANSGAVYVFVRSGEMWSQQAYIKASNSEADDNFGICVALSADGNTLAVGAEGEDSSATGINGNQNDNNVEGAGAAYVFTRTNQTWSQQAYIKAPTTGLFYRFGSSIALAADATTLVVGSRSEDSNATGINGDDSATGAISSGAAFVFVRSGQSWSQQAYIKASNTQTLDYFGHALAVSADGNTLVVGANSEDSGATGINGEQNDESANNSGAVYVFSRVGQTWTQQAYVKASNTGEEDLFGYSVTLSADGNNLAVGAPHEASHATGINGIQGNNSAASSGAVYLFARTGQTWSQQAYIKASNTSADDLFGFSTSFSADGNTLVVSAVEEDSSATGINADQANDNSLDSGAAYVFTREDADWSQQVYLKASNTETYDKFAYSVSLSADAKTLVIGAMSEDSNATGIDGNQNNNSVNLAGAAYVFVR